MHPDELLINDYADDALPPAERAEVEGHLAGCAECRALVDDLREIRRAAGALEPRDPPVRAWTRIERAVQLDAANRAEASRTTSRVTASRLWLGLAAAAVLILATAIGVRFLPRGGQA